MKEETPGSQDSLAEMKRAVEAFVDLPPGPATVRGVAGRWVARFFGRAMHWHFSQIRAFQEASFRTHGTQLRWLQQVARSVERLEKGAPGGPIATERGNGILDSMVTTLPHDQNALDIFRGEWASKMPSFRSDLTAGKIPLFEDARLNWAAAEAGGIDNQRVLELGPLEGGHTYALHLMGASYILAIEANIRAFLKCLIVKNVFNLDRAEFRCGNFMTYLREDKTPFDFVVASGVLYHMENPAELIELMSRVTNRVFIWTHYYDAAQVAKKPILAARMVDQFPAEHAGFAHTLHRQLYDEALTTDFTGGTRHQSCWMTREDILGCLRHFGFTKIKTNFEDPEHVHGPCFTLLAER